jgi:TonB family protein
MSRPIPAHAPEPGSANERLKHGSPAILWASMIVAAVAHVATFAFWPEMTTQALALDVRVITALDLPDEIPLPAPPAELQRPATPIIGDAPVPDDVTIGLTTHEANPPAVLTPPSAAAGGAEVRATTLTPFTVRPEILNAAEVQRAMARVYPPALRDARIGGTVQLSLFIDEQGVVREAKVLAGSAYPSLDAAALELSDAFRFSPALNRDKRVAVWVTFPVVFQVRNDAT